MACTFIDMQTYGLCVLISHAHTHTHTHTHCEINFVLCFAGAVQRNGSVCNNCTDVEIGVSSASDGIAYTANPDPASQHLEPEVGAVIGVIDSSNYLSSSGPSVLSSTSMPNLKSSGLSANNSYSHLTKKPSYPIKPQPHRLAAKEPSIEVSTTEKDIAPPSPVNPSPIPHFFISPPPPVGTADDLSQPPPPPPQHLPLRRSFSGDVLWPLSGQKRPSVLLPGPSPLGSRLSHMVTGSLPDLFTPSVFLGSPPLDEDDYSIPFHYPFPNHLPQPYLLPDSQQRLVYSYAYGHPLHTLATKYRGLPMARANPAEHSRSKPLPLPVSETKHSRKKPVPVPVSSIEHFKKKPVPLPASAEPHLRKKPFPLPVYAKPGLETYVKRMGDKTGYDKMAPASVLQSLPQMTSTGKKKPPSISPAHHEDTKSDPDQYYLPLQSFKNTTNKHVDRLPPSNVTDQSRSLNRVPFSPPHTLNQTKNKPPRPKPRTRVKPSHSLPHIESPIYHTTRVPAAKPPRRFSSSVESEGYVNDDEFPQFTDAEVLPRSPSESFTSHSVHYYKSLNPSRLEESTTYATTRSSESPDLPEDRETWKQPGDNWAAQYQNGRIPAATLEELPAENDIDYDHLKGGLRPGLENSFEQDYQFALQWHHS